MSVDIEDRANITTYQLYLQPPSRDQPPQEQRVQMRVQGQALVQEWALQEDCAEMELTSGSGRNCYRDVRSGDRRSRVRGFHNSLHALYKNIITVGWERPSSHKRYGKESKKRVRSLHGVGC